MKLIVSALVALYCSALFAGPAPWYRWRGPQADLDVCSQIAPAEGWVIVKGPFADALCRKPGLP